MIPLVPVIQWHRCLRLLKQMVLCLVIHQFSSTWLSQQLRPQTLKKPHSWEKMVDKSKFKHRLTICKICVSISSVVYVTSMQANRINYRWRFSMHASCRFPIVPVAVPCAVGPHMHLQLQLFSWYTGTRVNVSRKYSLLIVFMTFVGLWSVCCRRVNPFNAIETVDSEVGVFGQNYTVRFLGSQQVMTDRGWLS